MAVLDIANYPYDEQVVRERELRSPREARQTVTQFLAIITIAVTLESPAFIFKTGTANIWEFSYSTGLLMTPGKPRHWPRLVSTPQCAD